MVTALYYPESSKLTQNHVEDFGGFGKVGVKISNDDIASELYIGGDQFKFNKCTFYISPQFCRIWMDLGQYTNSSIT